MQLDKCDRCRNPESTCKCICPMCQRVFYDRRPLIIDGMEIQLISKDSPCTLCRKCHNCGGSVVEGRRFSIRLRDGTRLTTCSKQECVESLRNNPNYVEQKKSSELKAEDLDSGHSIARFGDEFVTRLTTPEAFGMPPDHPVVLKSRLIRELALTFWNLVYETKFRTHPPMSKTLSDVLMPSIEKENAKDERFRKRRLEKDLQRQSKYPDEMPINRMTGKYMDPDRINGVKLAALFSSHLGSYRIESLRTCRNPRFPEQEQTEAYYPMNASWWHLCRSILNCRSLDGMQPILVQILKNWFAMGLYPYERQDFLDIGNLSIKKLLTNYLRELGWNGNVALGQDKPPTQTKAYNADQTECIICLHDFNELVRIQPCGHRLFCKECSNLITKCSACSCPIESRELVLAPIDLRCAQDADRFAPEN
jgi:hypothetical protein